MMEPINQTNRTILFEEINPEKLNLLNLVGQNAEEIESLSDDELRHIHENLLVESFEEFLEKFTPTIYSFFNAHNQRVVYTFKKPETIPQHLISEVRLSKDHDFLMMLLTLLETEKSQKKTHVDFRLECILDLISPSMHMAMIKKQRQILRTVYGKYVEAELDTLEKQSYYKQFREVLEECSKYYNHIMATLPLAIEDLKARLIGEKRLNKKKHNEIVAGIINQKITGELEVLEAPEDEIFASLTLDAAVNQALIEEVRANFREKNEANDYIESLVIRTFCPFTDQALLEEDIEQEVKHYNNYLDFYKRAKDDFVRAARPVIEKILGIKVFFDQYQVSKEQMKPSLIITNISNEQITQYGNIQRLRMYLKTVNTKNAFNDCIWFGIIPSVEMDTKDYTKLSRERFKGNEEKNRYTVNTMESTMSLLNVLKDYKIQTFMSFELKDKTTFSAIKNEGISRYTEVCSVLERQAFSEYTIVCLPNFTIIPKDKSGIFINRKIILTEDNKAILSREPKDKVTIWIDGFYIGAAYVAAGIVAAYQCPCYLMEHLKLKNISEHIPGVRLDIESMDRPVKTTLAKEITGYPTNIIEELEDTGFGFIFASENSFKKEKKIPHAIVWQARSMKHEDRVYTPIFKTLICNYIERILRYYSVDFKQDSLVYFFSNHPNSQKSKWMKEQQYTNAIIGKKDELSYQLDEISGDCMVKIKFANEEKHFEVKINRQEKMRKR